jgi:hypothetical protein
MGEIGERSIVYKLEVFYKNESSDEERPDRVINSWELRRMMSQKKARN